MQIIIIVKEKQVHRILALWIATRNKVSLAMTSNLAIYAMSLRGTLVTKQSIESNDLRG